MPNHKIKKIDQLTKLPTKQVKLNNKHFCDTTVTSINELIKFLSRY